MFARAGDVIGAPEALARLHALTHKRRHEIACWVARLECIARKLIFAEAAHLDHKTLQVGARASGPPRISAARSKHPRAFDPAQPQTWPARFKLAPPHDPLTVPESRAPRIRALWGPTPPAPFAERAPAHPTPAPLRLAIRVEALRRVLQNPHAHALRLARLFRRINRRFPEVAGRYAIATARPHASDPGDPRLIIDALSIAIIAALLFVNTS
jgi:hypothetical protein